MWRPEGNPRHHSSVTAYHVFWRQGLSLAWNLPRRWHKPQGSSCLRFPSTQFTNSHHHAQVFFCFALFFPVGEFCYLAISYMPKMNSDDISPLYLHPSLSTHPPSYQSLSQVYDLGFCFVTHLIGVICATIEWELSPLSPGRSSEGLYTGVFPMGSGDGTQSLVFARQALYKQPSP